LPPAELHGSAVSDGFAVPDASTRSSITRSTSARSAGRATPVHFVSLPTGLEPEVASRHWKYIVFHHTATSSGDLASIDEEHRQRKDSQGKPWLGIGYHFLIGNGDGMADGLIEPTFRWPRPVARRSRRQSAVQRERDRYLSGREFRRRRAHAAPDRSRRQASRIARRTLRHRSTEHRAAPGRERYRVSRFAIFLLQKSLAAGLSSEARRRQPAEENRMTY